ncbi:hypothetical protein CDAR_612241 [Caerostris darwini]|uniref:Uncharacterized protein n=1 Tax=Caerostris darwini TaxID=1538125 RepID=A0AAV4S0Y7_9ARAC|nr:hypothetical protein CDAR_612241 [Caerostris darwini]
MFLTKNQNWVSLINRSPKFRDRKHCLGREGDETQGGTAVGPFRVEAIRKWGRVEDVCHLSPPLSTLFLCRLVNIEDANSGTRQHGMELILSHDVQASSTSRDMVNTDDVFK